MKELLIYKKYALAFLTAVKKPAIAIPSIGMLTVSNCQLGIFLLLGFMTFDFITGLIVSYVKFKEEKRAGNFFKNGIESSRLRLSVIKSITYFAFILAAYGIEYVFKIKSFTAEKYTEHHITLTLATIAISCGIEFYSIFFENLPKAGFSIEDKVKKIFVKVKSAVSAVKGLKNGNNSTE